MSINLLEDDLNRIMDVFTGADGGAGFATIRAGLLVIDNQKDTSSREIILLVHRFRKLLDVLSKGRKQHDRN